MTTPNETRGIVQTIIFLLIFGITTKAFDINSAQLLALIATTLITHLIFIGTWMNGDGVIDVGLILTLGPLGLYTMEKTQEEIVPIMVITAIMATLFWIEGKILDKIPCDEGGRHNPEFVKCEHGDKITECSKCHRRWREWCGASGMTHIDEIK